jgi:hypothetical protein
VVLAALKAMVAGAVQDRMAMVGVAMAAVVLVLTAWVLGVTALVLLLQHWLGAVGALALMTVGLILLAIGLVLGTRWRNAGAARERSMTRSLWVATAVNAAGALLRRGPDAETATGAGATTGWPTGGGGRSALLIGGGIALILLGVLMPSDQGDDQAEAAGGTVPDTASGPDAAA